MSEDSPFHWASARLGEIAEVRLGRQRSPARATGPNMVRYLRAANLTWHGVDFGDVKEMDFTPAEVAVYGLRAGDILLAEASGSASEVGKPGVYPPTAITHCFQNTLIRVRSDRALTPFLHLHFVKDALLGAFARASRGVGIHHLGSEALTSWPISLPPIREQGAIVDAVASQLSRLDAAVASLERARAKLKAYRASVLKAAVEGRLVPTEADLARKEKRDYEPADVLLRRILAERRRRWEQAELAKLTAAGKPPKDDKWKAKYEEPAPPDTSELPELPEGWCWTTATALFWDAGYGTSEKCSPDGTGMPVLRIPNVQAGRITLDDMKYASPEADLAPDGAVDDGDFLFIRTNGSPSLIGRGALVDRQRANLYFASYLIRLRLVRVDDVPRWLAVAWHAAPVRSQLLKVAVSSAGQHNVSLSSASEFAIPLPPAAEQSRILLELDCVDTAAAATLSQIGANSRRVARLRQSILKWAFEGKLVDQDPNDEPAEKLLARIRAERAAAPGAKKGRGRKAKAAP